MVSEHVVQVVTDWLVAKALFPIVCRKLMIDAQLSFGYLSVRWYEQTGCIATLIGSEENVNDKTCNG